MTARRSFTREREDQRRQDLVDATLTCIATLGMERTTVREIAIKAGVTAGLIRHYFASKDELVLAAYTHYVEQITAQSREAVDKSSDPLRRLAIFVRTSLTPPVVDQTKLSLWAGFIEHVRTNPAMAAVHRQGYLASRDDATALIRAALFESGQEPEATTLRRFSIAVNAIIDGLWLEGSMSPDEFTSDEIVRVALTSVEALLQLKLPTKIEI
jgi:TetR/AcrR family transcriptional regulator, transcriptional repressor of bet genes